MKYAMAKALTAHRDHDGPSRGPSTQPRFDRFSVIRIPLLLGFIFIINSSKNLILGVRLFVSELFDIRLFDCYTFSGIYCC